MRVKPYSGPEVEETYIVEIYQVAGPGEINNVADKAVLTVSNLITTATVPRDFVVETVSQY